MSNQIFGNVKARHQWLGIATVVMLAFSMLVISAQPARAVTNPLIVITETDGNSNVHPAGLVTDSYTIQLTTPPTSWVRFTVTTSVGGPVPFAEISVDGGVTWGKQGVILITAGDTSAHTMLVRWANPALTPDDFPPTARVMTVSHTADSMDPRYDFTDARNVYVGMIPAPMVPNPDPDPEPEPIVPAVPTIPVKIETAALS